MLDKGAGKDVDLGSLKTQKLSMHKTLATYYPNAVRISELQINTCTQVRENGWDGDHSIWATSLCSDEVNYGFQIFNEKMAGPGPFILGGITGLPFTGKTGMKAFLSHVPTNGLALILYGPHIGITKDGEIGKVCRKSQEKPSSCCGSISAAVNSIRQQDPGSPDDPCDYQQTKVIQHLSTYREEILHDENPIRVATEKAYELIEENLNHILEESLPLFPGIRIGLIGGIQLNTDWGIEDYFDVRRYEWLES